MKNLTVDEIELIEKFRNGARPIFWSVGDFEGLADETHDRNKFQSALETMIYKHDAEIGITWDTIRFYLDEYCKY